MGIISGTVALFSAAGITISTAAAAFILNMTLVAVSAAYQIRQAKKAREAARRAADARKGFEVVAEGSVEPLPIVYGRALVGGVRVYHNTSSSFIYETPNSDLELSTGALAYAGETIQVFDTYTGEVGTTYTTPPTNTSLLNQDYTGSKNEFLFVQQAICQGPINAVYDVIIDNDQFLDDPSLGETYSSIIYRNGVFASTENSKAAIRLDFHYNGGYDSIIAKNFEDRKTALFSNTAYVSYVVRLDRDQPQFQGVPNVQSLIEGRKVKTIDSNNALSSTKTYSNNPAYCLLDYLLDSISGKGISESEVDLASFRAAALICDTVIQSNVPVGGKFYKPTALTNRNISTRNLPLYECNIVVDVTKPVRENVEALLSTMGDARLVWSQGKYKLLLQYPATNANISLAATLTDDDLVHDKPVQVVWPTASEKLNFCTVRFHNEFENFKEDSVSWPSKTNQQFTRGIGGKRYIPVSGWEPGAAGTNFLNNYAVWSGTASTVTLTWKFIPKETGNYTIRFLADASGVFKINNNTLVSSTNSSPIQVATFAMTANQEYDITIDGVQGNSKQTFRGLGATLTAPSGVVPWTTRSESYSSFINVSLTNSIYNSYLTEDGGVKLETDIFAEGITDYYHALAKAEELVRTSRVSVIVKFQYVIKDKYLEPGDIIKLNSSTLRLGDTSDLYLRIEESKVVEGSICEVTGTRFDSSQLLWSTKAAPEIKPPNLYNFFLNSVPYLNFVASNNALTNSPGTLTWADSADPTVSGYILYFHEAQDVDASGVPIFVEIGRAAKSPFYIPALKSRSGIFGIRAYKGSALSDLTVTSFTAAVLVDKSTSIPKTTTSLAVSRYGTYEQALQLSWTVPALRSDNTTAYDDHYLTKIYRKAVIQGTNTEFQEIGEAFGNNFIDYNLVYGTFRYKVKFVSERQLQSEFSNEVEISYTFSNAFAKDQVLDQLSNSITSTQLATNLATRINLIDSPTTGLVDKVADLQTTYGNTVNAATSANLASNASSNAANFASNASNFASNAYNSAVNSAADAVKAFNSASNAANHASNAFSSANTASSYSSLASSAQSNAEAARDATKALTQKYYIGAVGLNAILANPNLKYGVYDKDNALKQAPIRSWNLVVVSRSTGLITESSQYDIYGDPYNNTDNATLLKDKLNSLTNTSVIFLYTYDEPKGSLFNNTSLKTAIKRCGGSESVLAGMSHRGAYILVGIPGIGENNGIEKYFNTADSSTDAFVSHEVQFFAGEPFSLFKDIAELKANASISAANIAVTKADNANSFASAASNHATNASTSANIASNHASNASISAGNAANSATNASNSESNASSYASTAANASSSAQGYASAASLSANSASAFADTASTKANVASESAILANTRASAASISASNAANSESNANTSASSANTSASLATTARNNAEGFANAASLSANSASSFADNASTFANAAANSAIIANTNASAALSSANAAVNAASNANTASANASNSANLAAISYLNAVRLNGNYDFSQGKAGWSSSYTSQADVAGTIETGGITGNSKLLLTGGNEVYWSRKISIVRTRKYKIKFRVRATGSANSTVYAGVATYDSNGTIETSQPGTHRYCAANSISVPNDSVWRTYEGIITGEGETHNNFRPGSVFASPMFIVNYLQGASVTAEVDECSIEDVTESELANGYAVAALLSANSASSYANNANSFANAAANSAILASTARDNAKSNADAAIIARDLAEAYASNAFNYSNVASESALTANTHASNASTYSLNAANSESNANSFASNASNYANVAANAASNASGFAKASSDSANLASSYADDANSFANAASGYSLQAQTFRDNAESNANAAITARDLAESYSNSASGFANTASGFALTANTYAGNALAYRNSAANSESNAAGYSAAASDSANLAANAESNASGFANAASNHASNAFGYANSAGSYASAASNSESKANTSAGHALTYSQNAANSATNAQGFANTAASALTQVQAAATGFNVGQSWNFNNNSFSANPTAVRDGLTSAVSGAEPHVTLLNEVVNGRPLGDINNSGSVTSADTIAMTRYIQDQSQNTAEINTYISNVLLPTLVANPAKYSVYLNSDVESFSALSAKFFVINGTGTLTSEGSDPILYTPTISLNGSVNYIVRIRIKRKAGSGWQGTVYYSTSGHGDSESFQKTISTDPTVLNEWRTLEWDMSSISDWMTNTITKLRFDFGATAADIFEIDWIATGIYAPTAYGTAAAVQQKMEARSASNGAALASYSVVVDANGRVAGFGLTSEVNNQTNAAASVFGVRADKFFIANSGNTSNIAPFIVLTTTDSNGNPPGVYIADAYIKSGSINSAKIGTVIQSSDFNGTIDSVGTVTDIGTTGWAIVKGSASVPSKAILRNVDITGKATISDGTFSGSITAPSGTFGGTLNAATGTFSGTLSAGSINLATISGSTTQYNSPGTYTLQVPTGMTALKVTLVGGGGGGSIGGGGGGGTSVYSLTVTPGTTLSITVGRGGIGVEKIVDNSGITFGQSTRYYPPTSDGEDGFNTTIAIPNLGTYTAGGGKGGKKSVNTLATNNIGAGGAGGTGTTNGSAGTAGQSNSDYIDDNSIPRTADTEYGNGGNSGLNFGLGGISTNFRRDKANGGIYGGGGSGGGNGATGRALLEFSNPNGIVQRSEFNSLVNTLISRGGLPQGWTPS